MNFGLLTLLILLVVIGCYIALYNLEREER
jgi:hypothetical protein